MAARTRYSYVNMPRVERFITHKMARRGFQFSSEIKISVHNDRVYCK